MIESELIPNAHMNENNYNNNNEVIVNNNCQLKFPFSIKPVDPFVNQSLLKDFTGNNDYYYYYSVNIENSSIRDHHLQIIIHANCSSDFLNGKWNVING